jgi:DNA polymerase I-like protein with 3'-5' exonuclease and polymerase domains
VNETKKMLGVKVKGYDFDAEYAAYFYDSSMNSFAVDTWAAMWWPEFTGYKEVVMPEAAPEGMDYKRGRKTGKLRYGNVPLSKLVPYNGADCDIPKRVELKVRKHIPMPLLQVYMDAAFVVDRMEKDGPLLDYKHLEVMKKIFPVRWNHYREQLRQMAADPNFNPNSPKQLKPMLYDHFKFECPVELERGREVKRWSTDQDTLKWIVEQTNHEFPKTLQLFKAANTIVSKSLNSYENSANKHGGALQTIWWLTGAITGRLRSGSGIMGAAKENGIVNLQNVDNDPIVQNMLISDPRWYDLFEAWKQSLQHEWNWRKVFAKDAKTKGYTDDAMALQELLLRKERFDASDFDDLEVYLALDHGQLEVRVLGQMSQDPVYMRIFESGKDVHVMFGAELTGWSPERIAHDKDTRVAVKGVHFAIIYGKQPRGVYQQLKEKGVKITLARVEELFDNYWRKFKRARALLESFKEEAESKNYVTNLFGFRRPIGGDEKRSTFSENQAVNSPIQGTAGQLLVIAMALMQRKRKTYELLQRLRLEIHDNNTWSNKLKHVGAMLPLANKLLCGDTLDVVKNEFGINWNVPLVSEASAGFRMGTMIDLKGEEFDRDDFVGRWCLKCLDNNLAVERELKSVERFGNVAF